MRNEGLNAAVYAGPAWRGRAPGRLGVGIGLAVGLPFVLVGLQLQGSLVIPATVPILSAAAITCLLLSALGAGFDSHLTGNRRSLPTLAICLAAAVMWAFHVLLFPGAFPGMLVPYSNQATSSVFLALNLALPCMLALALLQGAGTLPHPTRALLVAVGAGLLIGFAAALASILTAPWLRTVSAAGHFNSAEQWLGAAGLIPAVLGLAVFLSGRRGDERVSGGVAAALALQACNSVALAILADRYTPSWYADHLLAALAAAALLGGQLVIFGGALRRERRAAASLRTSLDIAEALARQVDLSALIEKLMESAMDAVGADRATLMTLDGDELEIEASIDRRGTPGPLGHRLPVTALQVDGRPVVPELIRTGRPLATGAYDLSLLSSDHAASSEGLRHYVSWPLFLGGHADAILFLGRRDDVPFHADDTELLSEFATIAAMLLRNARLLRSAEAASIAKGNFLNLAAHELRTPVSVIRGYVDLLAGGDLGEMPPGQREALRVLGAKSDELIGHVNQLLSASRLDSVVTPPTPQDRVELRQAADEAVARVRPRAELVDAEVKLGDGPVVWAAATADFVGVILDNLLNNALTYSRPPARVRVEVADDRGPSVRVTDSGIGIPADERSRVFERFHRVDRPDFGFPGGTGLGLFIVRRLAEAMGGSLELEWSELDRGSSFRLRLPGASAALGK